VAFDWVLNKDNAHAFHRRQRFGPSRRKQERRPAASNRNLPAAFSSAPWTSADGFLPGLSGKTIAMPEHITSKLTKPFTGEGTSENPYQIATAAQLAKLAELVNNSDTYAAYGGNNVYYKLVNNLNLSDYGVNWNNGKGWIPMELINSRGTSMENIRLLPGCISMTRN
jgi:hypothetical protein